MTGFVVGVILLVLFTITLVTWPLLRNRRGASTDFSRSQLNATIYRDQMAELERDRDEGALSTSDYEVARAELQRRLLEDTAGEATTAATAAPASRALPVALALALPLGAILLYLTIGSPRAIDAPPPQKQFSQADIEGMVSKLAARLEKEPDNLKGWAMLGRSYKAMGRYPEAVKAYERAGTLLEGNAELLLDYADTLAAANSGFDKQSLALIDKALKVEPDNPQGLWMRGTAAFQAKQYDKAISDWEMLRKLFPSDSEEARVVAGNIEEARSLKQQAGKKRPAS